MLSGSGCSLENSSLTVDSVDGGDDVAPDVVDDDVVDSVVDVVVGSDTFTLTSPSTFSVLWWFVLLLLLLLILLCVFTTSNVLLLFSGTGTSWMLFNGVDVSIVVLFLL